MRSLVLPRLVLVIIQAPEQQIVAPWLSGADQERQPQSLP